MWHACVLHSGWPYQSVCVEASTHPPHAVTEVPLAAMRPGWLPRMWRRRVRGHTSRHLRWHTAGRQVYLPDRRGAASALQLQPFTQGGPAPQPARIKARRLVLDALRKQKSPAMSVQVQPVLSERAAVATLQLPPGRGAPHMCAWHVARRRHVCAALHSARDGLRSRLRRRPLIHPQALGGRGGSTCGAPPRRSC